VAKTNSAKSKSYYQLKNVEPQNYVYQPGNHRYVLTFRSIQPHGGRRAAVIQMNGSTTNESADKTDWVPDPTIGKVLCWCYENKCQPFEVVHCLNIWSYVDTSPNNLNGKSNDVLNNGLNDKWIAQICDEVDFIIIAHGDCKGIDREVVALRKQQLGKLLENYDLYQVGEPTKKGNNPRHGRSWNGKPKLQLFRSKLKS
jgi:hypothetical protein